VLKQFWARVKADPMVKRYVEKERGDSRGFHLAEHCPATIAFH